MTQGQLKKDGKIIAVGYDYLTDDGRIIRRTYRGSGEVWTVEENPGYYYRNLVDAYNNNFARVF